MPGHYFEFKIDENFNIDATQQKKYWNIQALKSENITTSLSFEESKKALGLPRLPSFLTGKARQTGSRPSLLAT